MDKNKSVWDFMNAFIDGPEPDLDKEYSEIEKRYERLFGHGVPREMIPDSISKEQIKAAMQKCIDTNNDNLLAILGVNPNYDYLY